MIEEAKVKVPTIDLADLLCGPAQMRRAGDEWVGRCPLPDHEDRVPSFSVSPDKSVWFCHGCARGGDVVELARLAWGYEKAQVATAAAMVLLEFGHEVPTRPPSWFAKQGRQRPVRTGIEGVRCQILRRRLFKYLVLPTIDGIADDVERRRELERAWSDFQRVPLS